MIARTASPSMDVSRLKQPPATDMRPITPRTRNRFKLESARIWISLRRGRYNTIFIQMTKDANLKADVEGDEGILVIRGSGTTRGWNGIRYENRLSRHNVGARKLSMNVAIIPPGGVSYAHIHVDFEVML